MTSERESILLGAVQNFPSKPNARDEYKLDILVEDYLEQYRILKKAKKVQGNGSPLEDLYVPTLKIAKFLEMHHRTRLDLSVILTASILFSIPIQIFTDALLVLLSPSFSLKEIKDLYHFPSFIKTALVCIIRRICKRELKEISICGKIQPKPRYALSMTDLHSFYAPHFRGSDGFYHLRAFKLYMEMNLDIPSSAQVDRHIDNIGNNDSPAEVTGIESAVDEYSELEMEIVNSLPDAPTKAMCPPPGTSAVQYIRHSSHI